MIKPYFYTNTKNSPFAWRDLLNFSTNQDGMTDWLYLQHFLMPLCSPTALKIMVYVGIMQKVQKGNTIPMIGVQFCDDTKGARISYWKPT